MPAFNLTKDLYVESKIDLYLVNTVKDYAGGESCLLSELCALAELLEAENARQQIDKLKKVLQSLSKKTDSSQIPYGSDQGLRLALQFLVHVFFISTSKNPVRRVLISHFQGLSRPEQDVIIPAINSSLVKILTQPIRSEESSNKPVRREDTNQPVSRGSGDSVQPIRRDEDSHQPIREDEDSNQPIRFEDCHRLRHDVDTLSALLENFPLGEECLKSYCLEALGYLGQLLKHFYYTYSDKLSPIQQNEAMHNCLETVKLANRICQRSSVAMETKVKDIGSIAEVQRVSKQLIEIDICILKADEFLLDCRTTSAMNIALWLKILFVQKDHVMLKFLIQTIFKGSKSCDISQCSGWLKEFSLSQSGKSSVIDSTYLCLLGELERCLLSDSAYLCLCYGILAMLPTDSMLIKFDDQRCLLLDVLLSEFLALNKRCKDVGTKLLTSKSVCLLTQKLSQHIKNNWDACDPELLSRLHGESSETRQILDYIWTSWEDSVDAVRFTVKDTFEHVVAVHLNSLKTGTKPRDDEFLQKLTNSIIDDVSWSCKGKYGTLAVLVSHLGSTRMLELHSGIAVDVLEQLKEQTLACYASDLYEKLFNSHMIELSSLKSDWLNSWQPCWIDPVLKVLCGNNKTQRKHVVEYILPKLLKTGSATLQHIVSKLSTGSLNGPSIRGQQLGAMIICLRRARALGQLQGLSNRAERRIEKERKSNAKKSSSKTGTEDTIPEKSQPKKTKETDQSGKARNVNQSEAKEDDQSDLWYGVVEVDVLRQALSSRDDQVRLDAFALLCENQKTTELISDLELDLIKGFSPYNLNNQMPSFRQHFLSHLKKLLSRMKESFAVLKRTIFSSKDSEALCHLVRYKNFLIWLKQCMFSGLFPGATFARRTTCLGGLTILMETYGSLRSSGPDLEQEFKFFELIDSCDIQKLLHCLTDTFEDNKREAARILIACSKHETSKLFLDEEETMNLFNTALTLSCSSRPQDSTTAAYLLKVLIYQPGIFKTMQECGTSLNRKLRETGKEACGQKEADVQNEAGGIEKEACPQKQASEFETQKENQTIFRTDDIDFEDSDSVRRLLLLVILLNSLKEQVDVAEDNLIVAAANCPLYPTMQCMRYCLADIHFSILPRELHSVWKQFLSEFISLCFEISEIVSPVVHNSSPEGNIPLDALKASGLKVADNNVDQSESKSETSQSEDRINKSHETVMLMPEYLVVCCWRSVKEISLILGQLTKDVPVGANDEDSSRLLTHMQILDIGSYFTTQLLESKHRGAFELAYSGFVKVTEMLWRSSITDLHKLPRDWLKTVMCDIKSGDPDSRLCATRRSAGVPFYVQALVTTEPSTTGRLCFKETMSELLALASSDVLDTLENSTSKVHALNILRAMFKDTRLGDDVAPYTADGLKVAVLGFKSPLWAVRNSATLLMSAMMVRIFGVKRSKDETYLSRKNCQTGRTFFHRYPALYQFLLDQLAESTVAMETRDKFHLHPALYPVLMVLGHLFPSAMEGTDTTLNLMAFIPYVMKCSHSPVLKTRVMAAKALQPLIDKDHVTAVFDDLLTLLPSDTLQGSKQNHVHGVLLQIKQLLKIFPTLPGALQEELSSRMMPKWRKSCDLLLSRDNDCLLTRKETLEISCDLCCHFGCYGAENDIISHVINDISSHMTKTIFLEISHTEENNCKNVPGLTDYEATICKFSLKFLQHLQYSAPSDYCFSPQIATGSTENKGDLNVFCESDSQKSDICSYSPQMAVAESIILKFLKSSSYEVQKCGLEIIKSCLLQKQVTALQNEDTEDFPYETSQWDSFLTNYEVDYLFDVVKWSSKIYEELIAMVTEKELYHECLTEVFDVLQYHHLVQAQGHACKYTTEELLEKMIEKETSQTRDEVLTALIGYSGHLIEKLSQEILTIQMQTKPTTSTIDGQTQKKLDLIEKWASMIQRSCGTEQNSDKQLACVKAVAQNAELLLCDSKNILGSLTFSFWKVVLDLLQQDDLEVKDTAAGILSIVDTSLKAPVHPYLALDHMIGEILGCHGNSKMADCICFLIGLIAEDPADSEEFEERLFDRGEMNTYREPVDFIVMVDKHLFNLLRGEHSGQTTQIVSHTRKTIFGQDRLLNVEGNEHFTATIQKVLQTIESLVSDSSLLSEKSVFLNTNSFNRNFLSMYRALTLLKYGFIFPVEEGCRKKFMEVWEKAQVTLVENMPVGELAKPLVANIENSIQLR